MLQFDERVGRHILKDCIKEFVPEKQITVKPNTIPWCNSYTKLLLRKKNSNYKLYRAISEKYKRKIQKNSFFNSVNSTMKNFETLINNGEVTLQNM